MFKKIDNKGVSLLELIIAIAIMAVLVGVISPMMVKYVEKARRVKVEKETSEFMKASRVALVEASTKGQEPGDDVIYHIAAATSPYYKNKTLYGNVTNWTVLNGVVKGKSNAMFGEELFSLLGITIGKEWKSGNSSIPISSQEPKLNPAGSLTKECIFQLFYDKAGNMVMEYSREGYFVRMENSLIVESVKIKNTTEKHFTRWTK